jgi:hypothetical protein
MGAEAVRRNQSEDRCALCRESIPGGDGRYRIGHREYHPQCFDISAADLFPGLRSVKIGAALVRSEPRSYAPDRHAVELGAALTQ